MSFLSRKMGSAESGELKAYLLLEMRGVEVGVACEGYP
jgi:hypothetical protein